MTAEVENALARACVGVAGVGGLGSHAALALARAGVGRLHIADLDRVERGNLRRQQYTREQVGMKKVDALRELIHAAAVECAVTVHATRVTAANFTQFFGTVDVLIEAFDDAAAKRMLVETAASTRPELWVVIGSGVAGFGENNALQTERIGRLVVVGDRRSEVAADNICIAPRVGAAGYLQANAALEILLTGGYGEDRKKEDGADDDG